MALITVGVGFYMASQSVMDFRLLGSVLLGSLLVGGGSSALNQYLERDLDLLMLRTKARPLPAGRVAPASALIFGVATATLGAAILVLFTNLLTAFLAVSLLISYIFVYTPLKRKTPLCTLIGAVPGALPPLIGWAAATGTLSAGAWSLFGILFFWQLPHFFSFAWFYRDDFARAGFKMLPVLDPTGERTSKNILATLVLLIAASSLPTVLAMTGWYYFAGSLIVGGIFLALALPIVINKSMLTAKRIFHVSLIYLPVLLAMLVLGKR